MPIYRIPERHLFPDPELAEPSGLLGVGGDLDPQRVLLAYRRGIFPWFNEDQPILWWSPNPRMVLFPEELRIQRSLKKRIRQQPYVITVDTCFRDVLAHCAQVPRHGQQGTWITDTMADAYLELHRQGHAHSVEAWAEGQLVGGLYGLIVGRMFCGESMFHLAPDASKIAFVHLVKHLHGQGVECFDCQIHTDHLARFGAREIPRTEFLQILHRLQQQNQPPIDWMLEP